MLGDWESHRAGALRGYVRSEFILFGMCVMRQLYSTLLLRSGADVGSLRAHSVLILFSPIVLAIACMGARRTQYVCGINAHQGEYAFSTQGFSQGSW